MYNLAGHNARANHSRQSLFGKNIPKLILGNEILIQQQYQNGLVKCRVIFDEIIREITFETYKTKEIKSLKIIYSDDIEYPHKFYSRPHLDALYTCKGHHDEIIIVKQGLVTDAYYYNILCIKDNQYFTPSTPLLNGVRREWLIKNNKVKAIPVTLDLLMKADSIHLINAMTPPGKIVIYPNNIFC
jgi:4-amino-4-deoxychorismate lyase